jgi:2-methylcitrate dehydratase PrpD
VQSVLLARAGFTADTSIFKNNAASLIPAEKDPQPFGPLVDQLGKTWEATTPGISYKRWPCCYCNHRSVGAMLEMIKAHGIRADQVQAIEIGFPPGSDTALIHNNPQTGLEGKFSIEYVAAATVLDGKVGIDTFSDVMVQRPEVRAMMKKVRRYRVEDNKMYSGAIGYNDITLRTNQGEYKHRENRAPGSPDWPMNEAERDEKFLDCAGRVLGGVGARRVLDLCVAARSLGNVAELARAMVPAQEQARAHASPGAVLAK